MNTDQQNPLKNTKENLPPKLNMNIKIIFFSLAQLSAELIKEILVLFQSCRPFLKIITHGILVIKYLTHFLIMCVYILLKVGTHMIH